MKEESLSQKFMDAVQPKIGAGHAEGMLRQGLKELGQILPAFPQGQHVVEEPGLFGNLTPGEVAKGKQSDVVLDRNQEPKPEVYKPEITQSKGISM